jgi:hypothetical protein
MRSGVSFDPSVVEGMRLQGTRDHDVRVRQRPFGTKGSQVQILSPRLLEGRDVTRETDGTRPSSFQAHSPRTTGAPYSVTPGAPGAASEAVVEAGG